jgi:small subunit ribosomal protein S4
MGYRLDARRRRGSSVSHKSIMLKRPVANIPSMWVKRGDVVSGSRRGEEAAPDPGRADAGRKGQLPTAGSKSTPRKWKGRFKGAPDRSEFAQDINESLVVELYSK